MIAAGHISNPKLLRSSRQPREIFPLRGSLCNSLGHNPHGVGGHEPHRMKSFSVPRAQPPDPQPGGLGEARLGDHTMRVWSNRCAASLLSLKPATWTSGTTPETGGRAGGWTEMQLKSLRNLRLSGYTRASRHNRPRGPAVIWPSSGFHLSIEGP